MMNLAERSWALRQDILEVVVRAGAGHIGGDFSVVDILNVLYNRVMDVGPENFESPHHDRLILSKGHAAEALYCTLARRGFFPKTDLETYCRYGSAFIGHPSSKVPGVEMNSGSLGHGLPVGVGMALAARMDGAQSRVYVVMGDGELAEGSVWEAVMAAGHYRLANLCAVIDRNGLQISGTTEAVMGQEDLAARWRSFGWHVVEAEQGNDPAALTAAFAAAAAHPGGPSVLIAHTVKGYGVSFMENQAGWHHRVPTAQEYEQARAELAAKRKEAAQHD